MIRSLMNIIAGMVTCFIVTATNTFSADTKAEFLEFQQTALASGVVNEDTTNAFYKRSFEYWMANTITYNDSPQDFKKIMELYHQNQAKYKRDTAIKIDRFESTIENYRRFDKRNSLAQNPILFVGSSSIVFWETSQFFPDYPVINRGFGGASLPEVLHYYDDVIKKHNPSILVVYCDIDVERGETPEFAVNAFKKLVNRVESDFPQVEIILLSMKPTLIDDVLGKDVRKNKFITNDLLAAYSTEQENRHYVDITSVMIEEGSRLKDEIFISDGMHMNNLGYTLWDPIIKEKISNILKKN